MKEGMKEEQESAFTNQYCSWTKVSFKEKKEKETKSWKERRSYSVKKDWLPSAGPISGAGKLRLKKGLRKDMKEKELR